MRNPVARANRRKHQVIPNKKQTLLDDANEQEMEEELILNPRVIASHQHLSLASAKLRAAKLRRECEEYNWTTLQKLIEPTVEIKYTPTKMDKLRTALIEKNFLEQMDYYASRK